MASQAQRQENTKQSKDIQQAILGLLMGEATGLALVAALVFMAGMFPIALPTSELEKWAELVARPIPGYPGEPSSANLTRERELAYAYRAMYGEVSLIRLAIGQQKGEFDKAYRLELGYFEKQHFAEENRLRAAAALDAIGRHFSIDGLVSWRAVMDNRTTLECADANGRNFPADKMPVIGWPGAVHPYCRCTIGKPIPGAPLLPTV